MKKKDLLFLAHLRKNARDTLTNISKHTRIPISTLYDRLKYQQGNLITKHTTLIDFSKLGYQCRANIMMKVDINDREGIRNYLLCNERVNSLFRINNGYDYMIEGVFLHVKEMEEFLEKLELKFKVLQKDIYYVIQDLKRETFLGEPELLKMSS